MKPLFRSSLLLSLALAACGTDTRSQALEYARNDLACTSDADCCVAFDGCLAQGLVVAKSDQSTVQSLLSKASQDMCLDCIAPHIQVRCASGSCTGTILKLEAAAGASCDEYGPATAPFRQDHCGTLALPEGCAEKATGGAGPIELRGVVLGCGT